MYFVICIALSSILAFIAWYKKALTTKALILAFILSLIISVTGGLTSFLLLAELFLVTLVAEKIANTKKKNDFNNIIQKTGKRDAVQVFANVGVGAILLIFCLLTSNKMFLILYACSIAASLADSLSSELGCLSRKEPKDLLTWKKVKKGLSGGVTGFGLIMGALGSLIVALSFTLGKAHNLKTLLFVFVMGFLGTIIDSFLGSFVQVKYRCNMCYELTEKKIHCKNQTHYFKGIKWLNNDMVNLLSNIIIVIIAYFVFFTL